jgi:type II secretion system protein H
MPRMSITGKLSKVDGVVKSSIYCVAARSANARRTSCTPPLDRPHCALYIKLLYIAIVGARLDFYDFVKDAAVCRLTSPRSRQARRGEDGFTLIELVVVCFLIGLFLSLSIPSLRGALYADALKSDARKLVGLMKEVREQAVRENRSYLMQIDRDHNEFSFAPEEEVPEDSKDETKDSRDGTRRQLALADGVTVASVMLGSDTVSALDNATVWISPQGYLEEVTIRLEDGENRWVDIVFQPFVDKVVLKDE